MGKSETWCICSVCFGLFNELRHIDIVVSSNRQISGRFIRIGRCIWKWCYLQNGLHTKLVNLINLIDKNMFQKFMFSSEKKAKFSWQKKKIDFFAKNIKFHDGNIKCHAENIDFFLNWIHGTKKNSLHTVDRLCFDWMSMLDRQEWLAFRWSIQYLLLQQLYYELNHHLQRPNQTKIWATHTKT